jgi:outer membrane lipoprotein-sorting protein
MWIDFMRNRTSAVTAGLIVLMGLALYTVCRKPGPPPSVSQTASPPATGAERPAAAPKTPAIDEKAANAIADLVARWDQLQSFSAAVATELPQEAARKPGVTKGKGTYECAKRGDKLLIRFGLVNNLWITTGDAKSIHTGEILLFVYDGEFLYSQLQQPQLKKTTKSVYEPDRVLQFGGRELFRSLSETNGLKLAGEQMVDDRAAYVIEATPTTGDGSAVHYFDKQTGARLKMIVRDKDGKDTLILTLSDLKADPELSEDYFTYKLPEGFELIDKTHDEP